MSTTKVSQKFFFDKNKEEILRENKQRFTLFPIRYNDIWELYTKSLASFWTVEEIDFSADIDHWKNKLNDDERYFIKNVLAFFAGSDGIVNENLAVNFYNEIQVPEARNLYAVQMCIEAIHNQAYSLMLETYIQDPKEKETLFNAIETIPAVKKKADWALKWITKGSFPERLLAFAAVEGVFFSGSFCAIFWLKSKGLMPGLAMANQFISRDESTHTDTAVLLYSKLSQRLPESMVHEIFSEAYEIESEFITESLPVRLIGMNSDLMKQYIKFVIDYWLTKLDYTKLYNVKNPFAFMEYISLENQTNFFERRVSEYAKAGVGLKPEENIFSMDEDF
jgi:ribonucleoside-diphosphate reductase beta chain